MKTTSAAAHSAPEIKRGAPAYEAPRITGRRDLSASTQNKSIDF